MTGATEIARWRANADCGIFLHPDDARALLAALEQAQRAYKAECDEHKRTVDEACAEEDKLVAQCDAAQKERDEWTSDAHQSREREFDARRERGIAQQDAKDARALLEAAKNGLPSSPYWRSISARIKAMLEKKI